MTVDIALRVRVEDDGRYIYRCGWTSDGIDWRAHGCGHATPREASDHADRLVRRRRAAQMWRDEPIGASS